MVGPAQLALRARAWSCRCSPRSRCSPPSASPSGSGSPATSDPILEGALGVDTLALGMSMLFYVAGLVTIVLSLRSTGHPSRPATASTTRCCSGRSPAWSCWPRSESLMTLFIGFELLSIPLYVLCATHLHRRTSLEAGLKYLVVGSVGLGHAPVRAGARLRRHRGAASSTAIAAALGSDTVSAVGPAAAHAASRSARPGWRSRRRSRPSTSGRRTSTRAPPRRSPPSWRWPPRRPRSRSSSACSTTRFGLSQLDWGPALAVLAAVTIVIGNVGRDRRSAR